MDSPEKATNPNPSFSLPVAARPLAVTESRPTSASPVSERPPFSARALWGSAVVLLGGFLWLYWSTLVQLCLSWSGDEYYSHGPLIPFISAFLLWQNRAALQEAWRPGTNAFWGFVLLLTGLGIAFFGFLVDINFVRAFSIPIVALGIVRICGGALFERLARFPILLFAAGVPISRVVVQTFSVPLQKMAAGCASLVLGVTGLSVENDGVNIFTPLYNFVVDVPCSGLKTMTALLTVGLVVAYIVKGLSVPARVLLALSSVVVALVTNVIRIIIIILIGTYYGREAAEGFLHGFSNIVTMSLALGLLLLFGRFLQQKAETDADYLDGEEEEEEEEEEAEEETSPAPKAIPVVPSVVARAPRFAGVAPSSKIVLAMVALLVGTQLLGASAIVPQNAGTDRRAVANLKLPARSGAWVGKEVEVDPAVFEMLRPDAAVQKRYTLRLDGAAKESGGAGALPPGSQVEVIVIYSSDSRGFHAPEICLRAGGWTVSDRDTRTASNGKETVQMTVVSGERKKTRTHLAYYFGDTQSQASGWVSMLTQEALGRVMRKRTGTLEVQFAFSSAALKPNGDFGPQLSGLMLDVANNVRNQLAQDQAAKS